MSQRPIQRTWGQRAALLLCVLFGLVGLVPTALGGLVRTETVRSWAAKKTSSLIHDQLGIEAAYTLKVNPWPVAIVLTEVVVQATDGDPTPFATVEEVKIHPNVFSLIAGKLDVGDIEITGPKIRAVLRGGELANLAIKKQEPSAPSKKGPIELPFHSVSITDADVDVDVDGNLIASVRELDADAAKVDDGVEASIHIGGGEVIRKRKFAGREGQDAVDEDTLCGLEGRVHLSPRSILVRRFTAIAAMDFDPDPGTRPSCDLAPGDWRRLEIGASRTRVSLGDDNEFKDVVGLVHVKLPLPLAHRAAAVAHLTGSASVDLQVQFANGDKVPTASGQFSADYPGIDGKVFTKHAEGKVSVDDGVVHATDLRAEWGNGAFTIPEATVKLLAPGMPIEVRDILAEHVSIQGLLRDLAAHPQAHVGWDIHEVVIPHFGGTLMPLDLQGDLTAKTRDFGIYDRPAARSDRRRMISVAAGNIEGALVIKEDAVTLRAMHVHTPHSELTASVRLGFKNDFGIDVFAGSKVDLSEISPLASVQIGGMTTVEAHGLATFDTPRLGGTFSIKDFTLGGFAAGDIRHARADFEPLVLDLHDVELEKNSSFVKAPQARVDFQSGADVLVDADVDMNTAEGMSIRDFFEVFQFADDPRFASISGVAHGTAQVHYVIGGPDDHCGGGDLMVRLRSPLVHPSVFGETFDTGSADVRFQWDDPRAGGAGMNIDIYSASVRDGTGSMMAQAAVSHGGNLRGNVVASGFPLARLESLGMDSGLIDGEVSLIGTVGGTLSRPSAALDVTLTPLRIGPETLPSSHFALLVEPDRTPAKVLETTQCHDPVGEPFSLAEYEKDLSGGEFRLKGELFDGQVKLRDLSLSQQRKRTIHGNVYFANLDLGKLANLVPGVSSSEVPPEGKLSAALKIDNFQPDSLPSTVAQLELYDFHASVGNRSVELDDATKPITVSRDQISIPEVKLALRDGKGFRVGFSAYGRVANPFEDAKLDMALEMAPFDLASLRGDLTSVDRLAGTLRGKIAVTGPLFAPRYDGEIKLRDGALALSGTPVSLDGASVDLAVGGGEIRIVRASANVGSGTIDVTGRAPLVGFGVGTATANITARNIKVPVDDGIDVTADADLLATYKPDAGNGHSIPSVQGNVKVTAFSYTRPIDLNLNLNELSKSIKRTDVSAYDPSNDSLAFDVKVFSPKPLRIENDLVDMRLQVDEKGVEVSGTNQRYGARGGLRILPESKLRLRDHEFDVREGTVRFDDPTRIRPDIDVRAVTEYKRTGTSDSTEAATGTTTTNGQWDISIRAHGETDNLKLALSSDPPLDQEDIVLLLTLGMTRAEVDRGLAGSLGETVGLEALSVLTGADKAVRSVVPIIDYFHFGSNYSPHTGRTEPNVTIGKRLTDDVTASVTTTLTDREVGASIEWALKKGVSILGSYDNTSEVNTSIGNLGADLRWHLEFE